VKAVIDIQLTLSIVDASEDVIAEDDVDDDVNNDCGGGS